VRIRSFQGLLMREWKRRRVLVYWNPSYGSEKTKLLAYSLRRLLKKLRVMMMMMEMVRELAVSLKGLEKIAVLVVKVMVGE
jgi:hypothetical protein